jgi:CheY-like chemotaxis protein
MRQKILWVDDDRFFVQPYIEALEDEGFEVLHKYDATSGLDAFEDSNKSIVSVIVDMAMEPGSRFPAFESHGGHYSGLALARNVHLTDKDIPVIALCNYSDERSRQWFKDKGFPYLSKANTTPAYLVQILKHRINPRHRFKFNTFIVHGHDNAALLALKNYLQNTLKLEEPIVLRKKPSLSMTIMEKFEEYTKDIALVFVLLTPDDPGSEEAAGRRARQNVIFELGFFYGKMQRQEGRVILLYKGELEVPSDIKGIVYIDISSGIEAAGEEIRRELAEWIGGF